MRMVKGNNGLIRINTHGQQWLWMGRGVRGDASEAYHLLRIPGFWSWNPRLSIGVIGINAEWPSWANCLALACWTNVELRSMALRLHVASEFGPANSSCAKLPNLHRIQPPYLSRVAPGFTAPTKSPFLWQHCGEKHVGNLEISESSPRHSYGFPCRIGLEPVGC